MRIPRRAHPMPAGVGPIQGQNRGRGRAYARRELPDEIPAHVRETDSRCSGAVTRLRSAVTTSGPEKAHPGRTGALSQSEKWARRTAHANALREIASRARRG